MLVNIINLPSNSSGIEWKREQRAKADAENRWPHPNNAPYYPDWPKWMHGETLADLVADVEDARRE